MEWASIATQAVSAFIATAVVGVGLFNMLLGRLDKATGDLSKRHEDAVKVSSEQFQEVRNSINEQTQQIVVLSTRVGTQNGRVSKLEDKMDYIDQKTIDLLENPPYFKKDEMLQLLTHNLQAAVRDAMESLDRRQAQKRGNVG